MFLSQSKLRSIRCLGAAGLLVWATAAQAGNYLTNGGEFAIAGRIAGDQVQPQVRFSATGGLVVWEDAFTDGSGKGISARRLDGNLSGSFAPFRVNQLGADDQERAQVTMLNDGGAAFVWQGGKVGFQHIYARFMSAAGTFVTGDILVNSSPNGLQLHPHLATLANGNVIMTWCSIDQVGTNSLQDVYAQLFTPAGAKIGSEFLVNQFTSYNQRSVSVAPLATGGFVVVWISEQQRASGESTPGMLYPGGALPKPTVDVYGRVFNAQGGSLGDEFVINTQSNICANPVVAGASDGTFAVAWSELDSFSRSNSWDVCFRPMTGAAGTGGVQRRVNTITYGDQAGPKIAASGVDYLVVYTSLGHDGSREGVYGQFMKANSTLNGQEMRINTTTVSQQIDPSVAADGFGKFLVTWTSYTGSPNNFDLFAQRYADTEQALSAPGAPYVTVLSSSSLAVSWPPQQGLNVASYEVYADGAAVASASVTNTYWTVGNLSPGTTHNFRLAYVLADGRRSPLSEAAANTTYQALSTWGSIPQEWMIAQFGNDMFLWPSPYADTDHDGASNLNEFLAGTNPNDAGSVLKARLHATSQGVLLEWNTEPALVYQVQTSSNMQQWSNYGAPRFAAGDVDSVDFSRGNLGFFRVIRLR